jgi:hypothetical protein
MKDDMDCAVLSSRILTRTRNIEVASRGHAGEGRRELRLIKGDWFRREYLSLSIQRPVDLSQYGAGLVVEAAVLHSAFIHEGWRRRRAKITEPWRYERVTRRDVVHIDEIGRGNVGERVKITH